MTLRVYVIAGEPSGDALGARLIAGLRDGGPLEVAGIGGGHMAAEGVTSLFPLEEIAVMGLVEILPRASCILRLMDRTAANILDWHPDAVITIDSAGFNKGIARRLIKAGFGAPRIHYVAPMVWVWWPGRARKMARLFDHLLVLWPFELEYFEREGLATSVVGHPVIEAPTGDGVAFRERHGIAAETPVVALLPGSRTDEIRRLLPVFRKTIKRLAAYYPDFHLVVPTVSTVAEHIKSGVGNWPWPATFIQTDSEKHDAFAASRAALGTSGTIALELALAGVPQITAYRVSPISAFIGLRMAMVKRFSLVNLLTDMDIIPEFIQSDCRPDRLAAALVPLMANGPERQAQLTGYARLQQCLLQISSRPSKRAAEVVRQIIKDEPP